MQLYCGKDWFFYQTGDVQNGRSLGGMLKKDYFGFTLSQMSERGNWEGSSSSTFVFRTVHRSDHI